MKKINVDKGDRVRAGQVIAMIESPETDQQVANARANYNLAMVTDQRYRQLLDGGVIAKQDFDNRARHHAAGQGDARAEPGAAAIRDHPRPFDGIVTVRYVDPGHLVPQGTAGAIDRQRDRAGRASSSRCASMPTCRRASAPFMHNGDPATITVNEYPGRKFVGTVTRHPEALSAGLAHHAGRGRSRPTRISPSTPACTGR